MKKLFKGLIYSILLIYTFIAFAPKQQAFYKLEHLLADYKIVINKETLTSGWFDIIIKDFNLLFETINIAKVKSFDLQLLLFQNHIHVNDIEIVDMKNFLPPKIKFIKIDHSLIMPHIIYLNGQGDFGKAFGQVDLVKRKVIVNFQFSANFASSYKTSLIYLKRTQEGGYSYEYSF